MDLREQMGTFDISQIKEGDGFMVRIDNPGEYELIRFDGCTAVTVYSGSFGYLMKRDLKWREDPKCTEAFGVLTLSEIWEQVSAPMVTVFIEGPLSGKILQAGNYADNGWYEVGDLAGYA